MPFIADASVALAWAFRDERSDTALALLSRAIEDGLMAPAHFPAEVANGLWKGEPKRITPNESADFIEQLQSIDISFDRIGGDSALTVILPLARAHRLTIYDALYLELAERSGLMLATFDGPLRDAARSIGLDVVS